MKFLVAPESMRAIASALFDFECMKNHNVIDFLLDMYTFEVCLRLINAVLIKLWENPAILLLPLIQ